MAEAEDTQSLWREYRVNRGDKAIRDRLILTYAPLVKYVAGRLGSGLPAHVDEGDLVSYGLLGLIGAIERYDPERDVKFETYAIPRIKGAIIDELRAMDWVPRSVRFKAREIDKAMAELESRLKRAPTEVEMAEHLGVTVTELQEVLIQSIPYCGFPCVAEAIQATVEVLRERGLVDDRVKTAKDRGML